jgi:hypothetical protein
MTHHHDAIDRRGISPFGGADLLEAADELGPGSPAVGSDPCRTVARGERE